MSFVIALLLRPVTRTRKEFTKRLTPEQIGTGAKVRRNVGFSALRAALIWPIPFLLIPFILEKIGTRGYGTWAVFLMVMGFTSLSDFGLGGTLTKYVAEHYATGDMRALKRALDTGLMLYLVLACLVACVLGFGSGWLVPLLFRGDVSLSLRSLVTLWYWLISVVAINMFNMPFYSVVTGLQRMDLSNLLTCFNSVAFALLAVLFLLLNFGLKGLLYAAFLNALLTTLLTVAITRRILPSLRINPLRVDRSEIRELFTFSLQLYVTQTFTVIQNQIEKLYLAWLVGATAVGWYNIAAEVAQKIRRIPELLLSPVMAAASELHSVGDQPRLTELYYRSHKYVALFAVPLTVYVAAISRSFVVLWLGVGFRIIALPLAVLVLVNFLNLACGPGALILTGQGNLRPAIVGSGVSGALIIPLSLIMIYRYGFAGAVAGILFATIIGTLAFLHLFHKSKAYSFRQIASQAYLKPILCSFVALAAVHFAYFFSRLGWFGLATETALFGLIYILGLVLTRFFDAFDFRQAQALGPLRRLIRPEYFARQKPAPDV